MNENQKKTSPSLSIPKSDPNAIKSNLKQLLEVQPESKPKETTSQKNLSSESPILKIAKKQKSKQISEMQGDFPDRSKNSSHNSFGSLENELAAIEANSPKKITIKTPEPQKNAHKISKSTFLQHKYLENLVAKPANNKDRHEVLDNLTLEKPNEIKPFSINLSQMPNPTISEVDPLNEETPNNLNFKFKFTKKEEEAMENRKTMFVAKDLKANKKEVNELDNHPFRHLIFSPKITENLFKKHLLISYKGIIYSQKLQQPSESFLKSRAIMLPENKNREKTLFIDLDETLIHSCHPRENPEIVLEIGDKKLAFNVRPFCKEFLEKVSKYYEIYLFTASSEAYAKAIINHIDEKKIIRGLFTDKVTMNTKNGFIIKDLRIFLNRNLKNMIIVDNLAHCFSYQIDNGVPLLEWQSDVNDKELKYLYEYLKKAAKYDDLREYNIKMLKLRELGQLSIDELKL